MNLMFRNYSILKLITTLILIGVVVIVVEFVLTKLDVPSKSEVIPIGWTYQSNNQDVKDFNQYGFKGKKIPSEKKSNQKWILLLGDSQVESLGLDDSLQMEYLLGKKMNQGQDTLEYIFFTIGTGGYGQDQQLIWLQKVLERHPIDMVMLWFTPENDVWNNMFPTHWPWNGTPKPTFVLHDERLALKLDTLKYELKSKYQLTALFEKISLTQKYGSLDDYWSEKYLPPNEIITRETLLDKKKIQWIGGQERLDEQKTHLLLYTEKDTKRLQYGLKLTSALLDSIKNMIFVNGADFKIFVAGNHFYESMYDGKWMYDHHLQSFFQVNKSKYQKRLEELLKPFDSKIFYLATENKSISESDTYHLNQAAQAELADSLAVWLLSHTQ